MEEAFVRDTIRMAHAFSQNPASLTAVAESLGYVGMTSAQLMGRITLVQQAATAGSQVAQWVAAYGGGGVLAGASADLAAAAGVGASAAPVAAATAIPGWAIAVGALAAVAVVAAGVTGYHAWSSNRDADAAERAAARNEQLAQDRRDQIDSGTTALRDDQYVVVQVSNHPGRALAVLGAAQYAAHQDGSAPMELCNFLHGGRCGGEEVDTPNGAVVTEPSPEADLSLLATVDSSDAAWKDLCDRLTNVRPAPLAEGFVGDSGGEPVTIDYRGIGSPC